MNNTIILLKGFAGLTYSEYKRFTKGDTIYGNNSMPEELQRWNINDKEEAKKELAKHKCTYKECEKVFDIEEYALEYCECNEYGEFIDGSDYDFAEEL